MRRTPVSCLVHALVACLLGGLLATGCRPPENLQGGGSDAGTTQSDAGTSGPDSGTTTPEDAGSTGQDAGSEPPDGGSASPDAGTEDAGTVLRVFEVSQRKPNLMLTVDTSGSMTLPVDPTDSNCIVNGETCGGARPCDTTRCPTRWSTLQTTMSSFLSQHGTMARLGLGTYPRDASCGPSTNLRIELPFGDDDATLQATASMVNTVLQGIRNYDPVGYMPEGGSPTGASLRSMASRPELQSTERADFVLLLTEGLPNCNESYPSPYPDAACFCTLSVSSYCSSAPHTGCMDDVGSISAVRELRSKDIRTIVMDFGAAASSSMEFTLFNTLAEEGGFARRCQQDSDCGAGDSCNLAAGACGRRFYQPGDQAELVAALQAVNQKMAEESCFIGLKEFLEPYTQESLQVSLDGQVLAPGPDSWSLTSEGLRFIGSGCQKIAASTSAAPVRIELRVFP